MASSPSQVIVSQTDPIVLAYHDFWYNCLVVSLFTLILYEHVINIPSEVSYIWRWNFKPITIYLLILRYHSLAYITVYAATVFVKMEEKCMSIVWLTLALGMTLMASFGIGVAYRVYALSQRSWLRWIALLLAMGPVATNIKQCLDFASLTASFQHTTARCVILYTPLEEVSHTDIVIDRLSATLADILALLVTLKHTFSSFRSAARINMNVPIVIALQNDAILYFLAMVFLNIVHILLVITNKPYVMPANVVLNPIILSRLFLDLRAASDSPATNFDSIHSPERISTLAFATIHTGEYA